MSFDNTIQLGGTARSPQDVEALQGLGLQFAEIAITDPPKFSPQVGTYREVKERVGIYYLCHGPREGDPNDTRTLEEEYFPRVKQIFPLMQRLDMRLLTVHLWLDGHFVKEKTIRYKVDLLKRMADLASEKQMTLCIENLSEAPADMEIAFREVPQLEMTLDLGHAQLFTEINRSHGFLDTFPEKVKHVHMHDNRGGRSHLADIHLPPGEGIIDFEGIFKKLRQTGYSGTLTLELKPEEIRICLPYVKRLLSG